jgi:hypothetical protein
VVGEGVALETDGVVVKLEFVELGPPFALVNRIINNLAVHLFSVQIPKRGYSFSGDWSGTMK